MCFLLLHHRVHESLPVVLLANRDEQRDRPFQAPARWPHDPAVIAPKDARAGGTWLGVREGSFVVAITNRGVRVPDGVRSRGRLVEDLLGRESVEEALPWLGTHLRETPYAGFHLLLADADRALAIRHERSPTPRPLREEHVIQLGPGSHVVTNRHELREVPVPPEATIQPTEPLDAIFERLAVLARDPAPRLPGGHSIMQGGAIHGTVCSALIALPGSGSDGLHIRFAGGPPDLAPFEPLDLGPSPGAALGPDAG